MVIQALRRLLRARYVRFPLSVAVVLLIFNAIGVGADQQIIPDWALLKTTQQECNCLYGPTAVPTNPGGGGGGGPTPTPAPPQAAGGVGFGSWNGSSAPSSKYGYASIDASQGQDSVCPDPQNPYWVWNPPPQNTVPAGANAWITQTNQNFNGFWFLRSLEFAQNVSGCKGSTYANDSAFQWGADQAGMFVAAINALPSGMIPYYLANVFADVEWNKIAAYSCQTCPGHAPSSGVNR